MKAFTTLAMTAAGLIAWYGFWIMVSEASFKLFGFVI